MKKLIVLLILIIITAVPIAASAGGAAKSFQGNLGNDKVGQPPARVVPAPQPPPIVSQAPVQRREVVIRREEQIVHDYRYTYRHRGYPTFYGGGYYGGGAEIGIFISPYSLAEWRNLSYFGRPPPVCYRVPAHWEEVRQWRESGPGIQALYLERVWVQEKEVCR